MSEKPILFSGPMVRAILEGRKTQTRRVVRRPYVSPLQRLLRCADGLFRWWLKDAEQPQPSDVRCPYGKPGDRLWVRETWRYYGGSEYEYQRDQSNVIYRATPTFESSPRADWRPSIFMPRWASRITLEVTDVRVQRLQEISSEDALDEGIFTGGTNSRMDDQDIEEEFASLWDSINAKRAPWSSNPWVWAITFKRVQP